MKRPLAYITAAWYGRDSENAELVDMISGIEVKEDDFMNAVDYMFAGWKSASRTVLRSSSTKSTSWPAVIYALRDFKAKGMSGKHMTGTVIYGYLWDEKREIG